MAVGDDAAAAGFALVNGATDLAKEGDTEINRTRDYVAQTRSLIPASKGAARTAAGISSGFTDPTGGENGDIYFKIVS